MRGTLGETLLELWLELEGGNDEVGINKTHIHFLIISLEFLVLFFSFISSYLAVTEQKLYFLMLGLEASLYKAW